MEENQEPFSDGSNLQRSIVWVKDFIVRRKFLSAIILAATIVVVQIMLLPFGEISQLKSKNPTSTAFMNYYTDQAKARGKPFRLRHSWVGLNRISKSLVDAVVVSEDGSFWSHSGFDWFEFRESVMRNVREGRAARGASTISQQLVKNLYLSPSKNPLRKLKEWILTWWLEQNLTKSRILELYLNLIEWGEGIYGIQSASEFYYGIFASELGARESARLAAVIPNPKRWSPIGGTKYIERRAELIVQRMLARGMLQAAPSGVRVDSAAASEPLPEEPETPESSSPQNNQKAHETLDTVKVNEL
jgi:monofunctional biosynthetic peptidoglycan transglycosylase